MRKKFNIIWGIFVLVTSVVGIVTIVKWIINLL